MQAPIQVMESHESMLTTENSPQFSDRGPTLSEILQARVAVMITNRLGGQVHHFRLLFRGPSLVIQGRTHSYYAKQIVQHLVLQAAQQGHPLINEIEID